MVLEKKWSSNLALEFSYYRIPFSDTIHIKEKIAVCAYLCSVHGSYKTLPTVYACHYSYSCIIVLCTLLFDIATIEH